MLTLYHAKYTRSIRVRQLLIELGFPHTLERVEFVRGDVGGEAFAQINPMQRVPVLLDGDRMLIESIAILIYLLTVHAPSSRLGVGTDDREYGLFLQWLEFGESGLGAYATLLAHHTRLLPDEQRVPAVAEAARGHTAKALDFLVRGLARKEFLLKRGFTAADISVGYALFQLKLTRNLADTPQEIQDYAERLFARPSWIEASAD